MKKTFVLILCMCMFFSVMAEASTIYKTTEIRKLEAKYGGTISINPGYTGKITPQDIEKADRFLSQSTHLDLKDVSQPPINTRGTKSGTASVWAGIPALGHCYINTPYTISYYLNPHNHNEVTDCTLESSYMSGVAIASFSFRKNTWSKYGSSVVNITAYGTLTYGIPDTPLSYTTMEQAFLTSVNVDN